MSTPCVDQLLTPDTITSILSILLFISEILPYVRSIRANGIIQSIHMFIFHRNDDEALDLLYGSINQ